MHVWPTIIRLLFIANALGNLGDALRARRRQQGQVLNWTLPKALGWACLFYLILPVRWEGPGMAHWDTLALVGLVLVGYGVIIEMTDASHARLPSLTVDLPHLGGVGPQHMAVLALFGLALAADDSLRHGHASGNDIVLATGFALGLVFGVRYQMRVLAISRVRDLISLLLIRRRRQSRPRYRYKPHSEGE